MGFKREQCQVLSRFCNSESSPELDTRIIHQQTCLRSYTVHSRELRNHFAEKATETGPAVPSRVSLLISILRLNLVLTYGRDSSRYPRRRPFIYLNRHTPLGQSRVYRVTQLRTDGVHCRESAGTGPVVLKVVPNGCCLFAGHHGPINVRLFSLFPHPLLV